MPVYPSHRECGLPDFVEQNTKDGALKASIAKDSWSLESATLPGVPFPIPSTGIPRRKPVRAPGVLSH